MSNENTSVPFSAPGQLDLPSDDGEPMETERHRDQYLQLVHTLDAYVAERDDVYVSGNMFVHFSEIHSRRQDFRGPDVFVVLDTVRKERLSWVVWEEGGRLPDVVIELLSDSTRSVDLGEKKHLYARVWRTPAYFVYDPFSHELRGFRLDPVRRDYVPLEPDARGDLEVAPLGLRLGVRDVPLTRNCGPPCLRWLQADGTPIPTPDERMAFAMARADLETARADAEAARAEAEAARAEAENARADAEKARADALEARIRELERRR